MLYFSGGRERTQVIVQTLLYGVCVVLLVGSEDQVGGREWLLLGTYIGLEKVKAKAERPQICLRDWGPRRYCQLRTEGGLPAGIQIHREHFSRGFGEIRKVWRAGRAPSWSSKTFQLLCPKSPLPIAQGRCPWIQTPAGELNVLDSHKT